MTRLVSFVNTKLVGDSAAFSSLFGDGNAVRDGEINALGEASFQLRNTRRSLAGPAGTVIGGGGRHLLAFDGALDNRDEVADAVALPRGTCPDHALANAVVERFGLGGLDRLIGSFVMALWQNDKRNLILYRSAFTPLPLFFVATPSFIAVAGLPQLLASVDTVPHEIDVKAAARMAAGFGLRPGTTLFAGIEAVEQGKAVILGVDGTRRSVRPWAPTVVATAQGTLDDLAVELRARFDLAVRRSLAGRSGRAASHLSAGRDSAAVTAVAASILAAEGERLTALTAAPPTSFVAEDPLRNSDESPLAMRVAGRHANIDHTVCRPRGDNFLQRLRAIHRADWAPVANPANVPWWTAMNDAAAASGADVLLHGSLGNGTISAGGPPAFVDFAREQGWRSVPAFAQMLSRPRGFRRRTLIKQLLGPRLSRQSFGLAMRLASSPNRLPMSPGLLRAPYRNEAQRWLEEDDASDQPTATYREDRALQLMRAETVDVTSEALFGLHVRDPTADRSLIGFCLSLPSRALVSADGGRPVYDRAFRDVLPAELIASRKRGFQSANWIDLFPPDMLRAAFRRLSRHRAVQDLIDLGAIERRLDNWPTTGAHRIENLTRFRSDVLGALAVCDFIEAHFPD